jgi:hypothetical protein
VAVMTSFIPRHTSLVNTGSLVPIGKLAVFGAEAWQACGSGQLAYEAL